MITRIIKYEITPITEKEIFNLCNLQLKICVIKL